MGTSLQSIRMNFAIVSILFASSVASSYGDDIDVAIRLESLLMEVCDTDGDGGLSWCEVLDCEEDNPKAWAELQDSGFTASLDNFNKMAGCEGVDEGGDCNDDCILTMDQYLAAVGR